MPHPASTLLSQLTARPVHLRTDPHGGDDGRACVSAHYADGSAVVLHGRRGSRGRRRRGGDCATARSGGADRGSAWDARCEAGGGVAMATKLTGTIVREIEIATGVDWSPRGWPAELAAYRVEITARGIRIRHKRGKWFVAPWAEVLGNADTEQR